MTCEQVIAIQCVNLSTGAVTLRQSIKSKSSPVIDFLTKRILLGL
jgi:hypothetical protein